MSDKEQTMYKMFRDFAVQHSIVLVTAIQSPRPSGYQPYLPPTNDIIIVDYIDILK